VDSYPIVRYPNLVVDPLEDVMTTMRVASSLYVHMQLRAPYGIRFDTRAQARLVVIARGSSWVVADDLPEPVSLAEGDCLIVKAETQFALQDELGRGLVPCDRILSNQPRRRTAAPVGALRERKAG
jgi:uncharacterized protein with PhoU and TrkA domain